MIVYFFPYSFELIEKFGNGSYDRLEPKYDIMDKVLLLNSQFWQTHPPIN